MDKNTRSVLVETTRLALAKIPDPVVAGLVVAAAIIGGTLLLLRALS